MLSASLALLLAVAAAAPPASVSVSPAPSAPAAAAAARKRVLVPDFSAQGVDANTTRTIADSVAAAIAKDGALDVISGADMRAIVDVQASKQALGCDAVSQACLAELAGALSADLVVTGSVGSLGTLIVVNLGLYDAKQQHSVGKQKVSAEHMEELAPKIDAAVATLFQRDVVASGPSPFVLAGAGIAAVGAVGVALTAFGAANAYAVQDDAKSAGADKQSAEQMWPLYVGGVVASSVVVAGGAGLLVVGLAD